MPFLPFLAFLITFFLFAASSALTYLSVRSWIRSRLHPGAVRGWHVTAWSHALRTAGFLLLTFGGLISSVNDSDPMLGRLDMAMSLRILADCLILVSTPRRLRRSPLFGGAIILLLLGEAIGILRSQGYVTQLVPGTTIPVLSVLATVIMDCGVAILWSLFTRTLLRVKLTDRFALAFSVLSVFLVLFVTISVLAVLQTSLFNVLDLPNAVTEPATEALNKTLILLFLSVVAVSSIISVLLAQSLIAPVNRMIVALQAIGRGEWTTRLRGIKNKDEIKELASEINSMAMQLEEADALRAEFVSFVSHELRNPLTTVKGFAETLRDLDGPGGKEMSMEERAEIYQIICEQCERLIRMTSELLETSRVEAGKPVNLNIEAFDLVRQANKVAAIMSNLTDRHKITVNSASASIPIEADPDKIEQILINLLSNAIKYSPDGGLISVHLKDSPTTVEFDVRDNGVGMSDEQASRVFDKFYRIQDTAESTGGARKAEGTGIGLYLTRALVQAHGGTIRVESEMEKGSVFVVTLPRREPKRTVDTENVSQLPVVPVSEG